MCNVLLCILQDDNQEAAGLKALFKVAGLKSKAKPKKHRKLTKHDIKVLHFVARKCTERSIQSIHPFPASRKEWEPFCSLYSADAWKEKINLPDLRRWNVIRKTRLYDICNDLHAAQKWWSVARLQNNLLSHQGVKPPAESCVRACLTLLVCPVKDVPLMVQYLRVLEVSQALKSGLPKDFNKGAFVCKHSDVFVVSV